MTSKLLIDEEILIFKNERKQILEFIKQEILTKNKIIIKTLQTQIREMESQLLSSSLLNNELSNKQKTELELKISKNKAMLLLAIADNKAMLQLEFSELKKDKSKESILILDDLQKNVLKLIDNLEKSINNQGNKIIADRKKVDASPSEFLEETIEFNEECLKILQKHNKSLKKLKNNKSLKKLKSKILQLIKQKLEKLNNEKKKCIKKTQKYLVRLISNKKDEIKELEKRRNAKSQNNNQPSFFSFNKIVSFIKKIIKILINKKSKSNFPSFYEAEKSNDLMKEQLEPLNKKSNAGEFHYEEFHDLIKEQKLNKELEVITIKISALNQELTLLKKTLQVFNLQAIAECNNQKKLPLFSSNKQVRTQASI